MGLETRHRGDIDRQTKPRRDDSKRVRVLRETRFKGKDSGRVGGLLDGEAKGKRFLYKGTDRTKDKK